METDDRVAILESRSLTYSFLSQMFLEEMTYALLKELSENPPVLEGEFGAFVAELPSSDLERVRIDAAAEYSALFLNMSVNPVFPYESVYSNNQGLMMQEAHSDVMAVYQSMNMSPAEDVKLPVDHIGIELEFMSWMCQKEIDAILSGDDDVAKVARDVQSKFLNDHLMRWVPKLCKDISKRARLNAYRGLAEMMQTFLDFEVLEFNLGNPDD